MLRPELALRTRIAAALALTCVVIVGSLGLALHRAVVRMEDAFIEDLANEELDSLARRERGDAPYASAAMPNLHYYAFAMPRDASTAPPTLRDLGPGHHRIGRDEVERHVAVRDADGRRYIVAYDTGPHTAQAERFLRWLVLALAGVALLATALGHWLAGWLTRDLRALAADVGRFDPRDPSPHPPLARDGQDPDVRTLAHALDADHARIVAMVEREREFTANASHELRTPLAGIHTSCELLLADASLPPNARRRVEMVDAAARQMTSRMEALLYLARDHPPQRQEAIALRKCVEDVAATYVHAVREKGLALEVRVPDDATVHADRKALELVLSNLLGNAVRYTVRGFVRVESVFGGLRVSDSGPGIAPEDLPRLFERHYRGERGVEGSGLGLAMVRRICDDLGWRIDVASRPGEGATFTLTFA